MTPHRRLEIEQHANLYGSANGWAGTSGTLATMIRELLGEIDSLDRQLDVMDDILTRIFRRANYVASRTADGTEQKGV